ncbi:diaminopimelate epimerase [Croceifilum oryzae]|uniref:Diaminopimelate epimerase n=1 Tax=Croceifilum oryzae TaxID=1553429 RepID=A0AAJ1WRL6_9BACL|nr:diaminopimelate epimerase [Croceifilum oryzae]MDQ0416453.1 diaminopimelate epimerase [Croceifilum oryzae]
MRFTKMHGLSNDFVVVVDREGVPGNIAQLAVAICNRHTGIGADGLVYILPSEVADCQMRIFNGDGSESEQCGNAIRCVAKYFYERISSGKAELKIETKRAVQSVWLTVKEGKVTQVRVDMGQPILEASHVPVISTQSIAQDEQLVVQDREFVYSAVSMGNPHAVIEVENALEFPLHQYGPLIENHPHFPNRTNVEFITVHQPNSVTMRVWERGVGETQACGSGACATVVASARKGRLDRKATVHLKGGDLLIEWRVEDDHVYMTGPAAYSFDGDWELLRPVHLA